MVHAGNTASNKSLSNALASNKVTNKNFNDCGNSISAASAFSD